MERTPMTQITWVLPKGSFNRSIIRLISEFSSKSHLPFAVKSKLANWNILVVPERDSNAANPILLPFRHSHAFLWRLTHLQGLRQVFLCNFLIFDSPSKQSRSRFVLIERCPLAEVLFPQLRSAHFPFGVLGNSQKELSLPFNHEKRSIFEPEGPLHRKHAQNPRKNKAESLVIGARRLFSGLSSQKWQKYQPVPFLIRRSLFAFGSQVNWNRQSDPIDRRLHRQGQRDKKPQREQLSKLQNSSTAQSKRKGD